MEKKKSLPKQADPLPPAPLSDLRPSTLKAIKSMAAESPREGVRAERISVNVDPAKLKAYRQLRQIAMQRLGEKLQVEEFDAAYAAGNELRRLLAGQLLATKERS